MRNSGKLFSFPHSFLAVSSLTSCCFFRQGRWPSPFSSLTVAVTAFFRLTPRGKHPGKTNSKLYSTPLRTEVTTIHFSCHRVEAQPVTPSSLGRSGFAGSGGWGQRGWCSPLAEEGWVLVSAEITRNVDARTRGPAVPV